MSKLTHLSLLLFFLAALNFGCQRNIFDDETGGGGGNGNGGGPVADWEVLELETERLIKNLYATPFQLYFITENEYVRLNEDLELVEKRTLIPNDIGVSRPVLADNVFARMSANNVGKQVLEFHLARNPAGVVKFEIDEIKDTLDDFFEFEIIQRNLGAFNASETQFLIPARVEKEGEAFAVLYIFEIEYNSTFDEILNITPNRIELTDLTTDAANITNFVNIRFLKDHFFVSTKKGGYRISEELEVEKIFPSSQWVRDYFEIGDTLYMTGLNSFDMHNSGDAGLTWERLNKNSSLQMIENVNDRLFNQEVLGTVFSIAETDLCSLADISYSNDIPVGNLSAFYGLDYFQEQYFLSADTKVFRVSEISEN